MVILSSLAFLVVLIVYMVFMDAKVQNTTKYVLSNFGKVDENVDEFKSALKSIYTGHLKRVFNLFLVSAFFALCLTGYLVFFREDVSIKEALLPGGGAGVSLGSIRMYILIRNQLNVIAK